jgi:hypothetical protein
LLLLRSVLFDTYKEGVSQPTHPHVYKKLLAELLSHILVGLP